MKWININQLPKTTRQKDYIDKYFLDGEYEIYFLGGFRKVIGAKYGHCMNYPSGFDILIA